MSNITNNLDQKVEAYVPLHLGGEQLATIERIGSSLVPPASEEELEQVIIGVDKMAPRIRDSVRVHLSHDQDFRLENNRLTSATRLAADIGFATLRAPIQGGNNG